MPISFTRKNDYVHISKKDPENRKKYISRLIDKVLNVEIGFDYD